MINLTKLNRSLNNRPKGPVSVQIRIDMDGELTFACGDVKHFTNYVRLMEVLRKNKVDLEKPRQIYVVLAKHILNHLFACLGEKIYPDVI